MLGYLVDFSTLSLLLFTVGMNPALLSIFDAHAPFNMKKLGGNGPKQKTNCEMRSTINEIDFATPFDIVTEILTENIARMGCIIVN